MRKGFLLHLTCLVLSCGQGEFQDKRDYFQSIYGLNLQPFHLTGSAFIGRVVDADGTALPTSRIFLKGSPLYTTSNEKGGFLLTGLPLGKNTLFILSAEGLGKALNIEVNGDTFSEDRAIFLEKLRRISGRVSSGAASVSEARLTIEGSPFNTLSNAEGQYVLELPTGVYSFKVQHLLYNPYSRDELAVAGDQTQDIQLEPLGFPEVALSLERAEGLIIRGLTTRIHIQKSNSVRYMRVVSMSKAVADHNQLSNRWELVPDNLLLQHKNPGFNFLYLQFMDQFGRMTDALPLSYYNTLYDASWRLILGHITEPLLIKGHEKLAFLSNYGVFDNAAEIGKMQPHASTGLSFNPVRVDAPVVVEAGATIEGTATFTRSLTIRGTAAAPVRWNLLTENEEPASIWIRGADVRFEHAYLEGGAWYFEPSYADGSGQTLNWGFDRCLFRSSRLNFLAGAASKPMEPDSAPTPADVPSQTLTIQSSLLMHTDIRVSSGEPHFKLALADSNIMGQTPAGTYLQLPGLDPQQKPQIALNFGKNYFANTQGIIDNFSDWSPYLGTLQAEPVTDVGPEIP